MHRFLGRILASFIVLLFNAATGVAFTVERTTTPVTKMSKTTPGGPNYGQFGYLYAPSVMTTGGNTTAWTCGGLQTDVDGFGGDHLFRKQNWTGVEDVTLCPSLDNVTPNPVACSSLWRTSTFPTDWTPRDDRSLICDPSVVKIGSTYYMYYTGDPYKGQHGQMFRAHSTDGINWVKYPNNGVPAQAVIPLGPDQYLKFGIGEPSVVYRNGTYYMWYTDFRYLHKTTSNQYHYQGIYRATSTNGTSFTDRSGTLTDDVRDRVYPPCYDCASTNYIKGIPFGNEGVAGVEVRYVSGWDVWFMVARNI